ncbi:MAG: acetyl/propionyl/methylcrotonyl-CoA carboxylase subunit alpha, partial [Hyphomicrobiaceae bacterium]
MFQSILIANRGEIAVRVMRTARRMGARCIAVYSDADRDAMHVALADEAFRLGPAPVAESYLRIDAIIEAAKRAGAQAVHPGYGFLSENPAFVEACDKAGLLFIGPPASAIRAMGLKDAAKKLMQGAKVPVVPGYHGAKQDLAFLATEAEKIGYPVLIKARAGGGGKGMRRVNEAKEFKAALESAVREATSSFGDGRVLIEKYISKPRHIEVQVFADALGSAVHLFERDCSLQRRHQKVIEEAPAPGMTEEMRRSMGEAAVKAALTVGYRGAGTVEFIVDASEGLKPDRFYFMEMNTRLQVEHPVTEAITGHDLVEWQLRVAAGEPLPARQEELSIDGHAFEARLYAEDVGKGFLPATGRLEHLHLPGDIARIDTGVREGDDITPFYDPMIAKVIVHGPNRGAALGKLTRALEGCRAVGCVTNIAFLEALSRNENFSKGDVDTGLIEREIGTLAAPEKPSAVAIATGALAVLGLLRKPASGDPWASLAGWRHWTDAYQFALLSWGGEGIEARVESKGARSYAVTTPAGPVAVAVRAIDGDHVRLDLGGVIREAVIVEGAGRVSVFLGGEAVSFTIPERLIDDSEDGGAEDRIRSPMPGTVKLVRVKAGEKVEKGAPLVVLEAMKMEHTLTAPRDGVIAEVMVKAGEQVQDGVV